MIATGHPEPSQSPGSSASERRKLVAPLSGTVRFIGSLLLVGMAFGLVIGVTHFGGGRLSIAGYGGPDPSICVPEPGVSEAMGPPPEPAPVLAHDPLLATKPGATVSINGAINVCTSHPSTGTHVLYELTRLPAELVGLGVLFLLWRLVRAAERSGPFTPRVARLLRFTGWLIIAGSVLAVAAQGAATDGLLNIMLAGHDSFSDAFPNPGVLVIPVLAGVVALTFARIVRLGTRMDEDLQGTI